ncbi:hypothetical protein VCUG_00087 [Vavraia culicis subsp. floridensis]|uniref:F-box domain-containing protein n=1 Tax=Vavraia culicis (isolate floridensis) TaxID=948595 RepID=L2GYX6_VAVCU|nr:uncharacterized protein VCUG_00087 [Vavraia culicis subsp. floridensis]ELA48478.1 hypothetical protein VCUG_00087 [Vavraia culicis subsp. floridensis]
MHKTRDSSDICFPDLSHVEILEISYYNGYSDFKTLLTKCVNAKRLILRNIICRLHDRTKEYTHYNFGKEPLSFEQDDLTGKVESETDKILCKQSLIAIPVFVYNWGNIFEHYRHKTLQHLSITNFWLDEQCLEQISNFVMLETLSIVSHFISAGVFSVLPPGLKEFIITPMLCFPLREFEITSCEATFNENRNVCYRALRYLRIHSYLFMNKSQFTSFPSTIELLEIIPSIIGCSDPSMSIKIRVKELVISEIDQQIKCKIEDNGTMEEYYDSLLNILSYFIDFSDIARIAIRDGNFWRFVEPRDYGNGTID